MNRVVRGLVVGLLGVVLVGCTPGGVVPTDTPTPTIEVTETGPVFTPEEQAAIDAVHAYLEKWSDISQNLQDPNVDLNEIRQVASDPIANINLSQWAAWMQEGLYLVGAPIFTPDTVHETKQDGQGDYLDVYGCYILRDSYLMYTSGKQVSRIADTAKTRYVVLRLTTGRHIVIEEHSKEGETC